MRFPRSSAARTVTTVRIVLAGLGSRMGAVKLGVNPRSLAVWSVLWLALVSSIGAFVLLFLLLQHRPGASATSYLFLVPPFTALAGVPVLGQPVSTEVLAGTALATAGVALVTLTSRPSNH